MNSPGQAKDTDILIYIFGGILLAPIILGALGGVIAKYSPKVTQWLVDHRVLAPGEDSVWVIFNGAGLGIPQILVGVVLILFCAVAGSMVLSGLARSRRQNPR